MLPCNDLWWLMQENSAAVLPNWLRTNNKASSVMCMETGQARRLAKGAECKSTAAAG